MKSHRLTSTAGLRSFADDAPSRPRLGWPKAPVVLAAAAAVGWRLGWGWATPAMVAWAAGLAWLAARDVEVMVLPTRVVYATLAATALGLGSAALAEAQLGRLGLAAGCGVALEGLFALWAVGRPGSLGFGDVRLAGLIGLGAGWLSPGVAVLVLMVGMSVAGLVGLVGLATRRMSFGDRLPLGAFLAGAAVVVAAAR